MDKDNIVSQAPWCGQKVDDYILKKPLPSTSFENQEYYKLKLEMQKKELNDICRMTRAIFPLVLSTLSGISFGLWQSNHKAGLFMASFLLSINAIYNHGVKTNGRF